MIELIGIVLMVQGFGALIAKQFGSDSWLLMNMIPAQYQMAAGIGIGVVGLILTVMGSGRRKAVR